MDGGRSNASASSPSLGRYLHGVGRCVGHAPALVSALAPVGWPRTVERLSIQAGMADVRGAHRIAGACRDWLTLLGYGDVDCRPESVPDAEPWSSDQALELQDRRRVALADLADVFAEIDRAVGLASRFVHRAGGVDTRTALVAGAVLVTASPVFGPGALATAIARRVVATAPPLPKVVRTPHIRENLLTDLIAEALPSLLASAPARHALRRVRRPLVIGIRVGRVGTTVVASRDALRVRNGISRRVTIVLEGGVEPLLRRAAGQLEQEVAGLESH